MATTGNEYQSMTQKASPPSPKIKDLLWAFFVGGGICTFGQALNTLYENIGFSEDGVL